MYRTVLAAALLVSVVCAADDPFLTKLYDSLHDSPMQRKLRRIAPVPFGVVFLPWAGMTEQQMREHFRTMKKLGFNNLKQTMPSAEWTQERILEVALEEGVIPFWYGEGGWEEITPALLRKLGIPENTSMAEIRKHPKMVAYQKEIIRKGIQADSGRAQAAHTQEGAFRHTPDPMLRDFDIPHFRKYLRETYKSPEELNRAWNTREVGIGPKVFKTWEDVDAYVATMGQEGESVWGYGREYGRIMDVLKYKALYHTRDVLARSVAAHKQNPFAPTRTGGEMGLFLPFAYRATNMEFLAETQKDYGSFYPSIHFVWHFGEVDYEVARPIYMQVAFAVDNFKGGWTGAWESTGGPQQMSGAKGWGREDGGSIPGFTVNAGTMTQLFLSYLAGGFRGAGVWTWNYRRAGIEGGEYALVNRQMEPSPRAVRAGEIARAAERLRDELWQAHKEPYVGVLYNWNSDAMWAVDSVRNRDLLRHYPMRARVGVSRALINGNIPWEHVLPSDIEKGLAPRYKVIYLPAQLALEDTLMERLLEFAKNGGRVVLDAPGGWYDGTGLVYNTGKGSVFERLFGVSIADFQYSNNVPRTLEGQKLTGFILELKPTTARTLATFQTGEVAVTENQVGKGSAVVLGWDASYSTFKPGNTWAEERIRRYAMGTIRSPYACEGAVVYRLAAPDADHYFFINDDEPKKVKLDTRGYKYVSASDPVTGQSIPLGSAIDLEGYSGRWLRLKK